MAQPMTKQASEACLQKRAVIYLRVSTSEQANTDFDVDGFSIRAQREACLRVAEQLGAVVVDEYPDRGESAKSAARPELQKMLRRLKKQADVDYVIVHKVDRLARSREDDMAIVVAIRKAGAQLVSATENIDETPQGKLLHGIMATIAEFYSANLGTEAKKGMRQKAMSGGTPALAPIGYLNVGQQVDGKEIRTVVLDSERASHIRWAFQQYATGNWSIGGLTDALNRRGLRTRATQKRPSKELTKSQVENILKNPYYTGVVVYSGVEYPGRHEALVDPVTFQEVQAIRESRGKSREKIHQHPHYLKGSLVCGYCGNRLGITNSRGNGGVYPYFYCLGRQNRRTGCTFRHVLISTIEDKVEARWANVQLTASQITGLRLWVMSQLDDICQAGREEQHHQEQRLARLTKQRAKAKEAYYADAMPLDDFRDEQKRISREEADAKKIIQQHDLEYDELRQCAEDVLSLLADARQLYAQAPSPALRRMLNQAVFTDFKVYSGEEDGAHVAPELAEPLAALLGAESLSQPTAGTTDASVYYRRTTSPTEALTPAELEDLATSLLGDTSPEHETNRDPWRGHGSKLTSLAPGTGFEPAT